MRLKKKICREEIVLNASHESYVLAQNRTKKSHNSQALLELMPLPLTIYASFLLVHVMPLLLGY